EWDRELGEPTRPMRLLSLDDADGDGFALVAEFSRAGREHTFVLINEPDDCGAAATIIMSADDVTAIVKSIRKQAAEQGFPLTEVALDPAEFRWRAEAAMDARDLHDAGGGGLGDLIDDDGPGYRAMAPLVRARLRTLPEP